MIAPAIVKFSASLAVSIIQTLSDSPANNLCEIEENIAIPTPSANPTPAPSRIPMSSLCCWKVLICPWISFDGCPLIALLDNSGEIRFDAMGEMISYNQNGTAGVGYLAVPEQGQGPAVIVIQEWWGLVGHIADIVDRFAAAGFVAFAPDLYHGQAASEPDTAKKLMMELKLDA